MSLENFTKKMKEAASAALPQGDPAYKETKVALSLKEGIALPVLRLSRATGLAATRIVTDLLESNLALLTQLAQEAEKIAPKERLKLPLGSRRYKNRPNMVALEKFVNEKKRNTATKQ